MFCANLQKTAFYFKFLYYFVFPCVTKILQNKDCYSSDDDLNLFYESSIKACP